MIEKYINSYIDASIASIELMFGLTFDVTDFDGKRFEQSTDIHSHNLLTVNIPFSGSVSGDYFLFLHEKDWLRYFEEVLGDGSTKMLNSCLKELLNTIVGDAIVSLNEEFSDLSFLTPRIYRGEVDYPEIATYRATIRGFTEVKLALSLNMVKHDIGLRLDDALILAAKEQARARKAEHSVKMIMNNISAGIFYMDLEGIISPGCSAALTRIFVKSYEEIEEKSFDEACLPELLAGNNGEMNKWLTFVKNAPEGMAWREVIKFAPFHEESFCRNGKNFIYNFSYHLIDEEKSQSLMVVIEDITEQRRAEKGKINAVKNYKGNLELLHNVISLNNSEIFSFLHGCDHILQEIEELMRGEVVDVDTVNQLFRRIQNIKDGAVSLNFDELTENTYKLETYLSQLAQRQKELNPEEVNSQLLTIKNDLNHLYQITNHFDIESESERGITEKRIVIDENCINNLLGELQDLEQTYAEISGEAMADVLKSVQKMKMIALSSCEPTARRLVENLNKELGKKTAFIFKSDCDLPQEVFHSITNPLIQLIRNAMIHGIESPAEREAAGKSFIGVISVAALESETQYEVNVSDDGRGLDLGDIQRSALEQGIEDVEQKSSSELIELVFKTGFTCTKGSLPSSGRGIGLNLVKASVENFDGEIKIENSPGKGLSFTLIIPRHGNERI
ncbi:MAG: Hpt domain-containing protein [Lentisphaeraceae bacterium]|nr:Hpt domain-containing protein [Lentisphaeraceae bacterium]